MSTPKKRCKQKMQVLSLQIDGTLRADTRTIAEVVEVDHGKFFQRTILGYKEVIEEATNQPILLLEERKKATGRPQRYASLTAGQLLIALNLAPSTEKVRKMIAYIVKDLTDSRKKTKAIKYVWDKNAERIRPGSDLDIEFDRILIKTHFSPEEEFCKFFHQLETSVNFSLSFDWWQYVPYSASEDEEECTEESTEKTLEDEIYEYVIKQEEDTFLLCSVDEFFWEKTHCDEFPHQYWVTRFDFEQEDFFLAIHNQVGKIILLDKYKRGSMGMRKKIDAYIEADKAREKLAELQESVKKELIPRIAYGIKPHYDFVQWWQANDELVTRHGWATYKVVYEGELEVDGTHRGAEDFEEIDREVPDFYDGIQILEYKTADDATYDENITDPELEYGGLFTRLALYPHECKPVFDYYLQNIWYPEHSVAFIESVDPEGYAYLKEALPKISPTQLRMLPRGFVRSIRECLPESGQMLISAAIGR